MRRSRQLGVNRLPGRPRSNREASQEALGQERNVLATLTQGRHTDVDDVDAVVEVLTELAAFYHLEQIAMRGGDDAYIRAARRRIADRDEGPLLEDPQELDLQRGRHVAHLVEEEGPAVGDLEQARLVGDGAGEGAAAVTEELRIEEVVVEGRAILHDEPLLGATRVEVDRARDQLLAGAVGPLDQHRRVGVDHLVEHAAEVLDRL